MKHAVSIIFGLWMLFCVIIICSNLPGILQRSENNLKEEATKPEDITKEVKKPLVVIDPGHGGVDVGKTGPDGIEEKTINLSISLLLKEYLEDAGVEVYLTRNGDYGYYKEDSKNKKQEDIKIRRMLVNEHAPLFVISIHQNSFSDPDVAGPQVFYGQVKPDTALLAKLMQEQLNTDLNPNKPRACLKKEDFFLFRHVDAPVLLVECGFLSNQKEARLLSDRAYQEKIARSLCSGILKILNAI